MTNPDLLVVMMNPGSSKPVDGRYEDNQVSEAKPDRTQMQIIRVMNNCGFDYCRILNLTDIQEAKSNALIEILSNPETKELPHSIFDPRRKADFDNLYPKNALTLLAWGVHHELGNLASRAIEKVGNENTVGLKKEKNDLAYYHPLPPSYYRQQQWVHDISEQMENQKQLIKPRHK